MSRGCCTGPTSPCREASPTARAHPSTRSSAPSTRSSPARSSSPRRAACAYRRLHGSRAGRLPRGPVFPLPRPPRPHAAGAGRAVGAGTAAAGEPRLHIREHRRARGRRPALLIRPHGGRPRRRGADADRRPRPVRCGHRRGPGARAAARRRHRPRRARRRCASATASSPAQVPDFIALRGDPSDGIPGAPGIGAKTAAELLRAHDTLEQLLQDARSPGGAGAELRPRTPRCPARQRSDSCSPSRRSPRSRR